MIKTERGTTEIKGEINEILTDYELIARAMRKALSEKMGEEKAIEESIVERMSREIAENIRKFMTKRK